MAETVEEQMEYGSFCKHGTNIGTPGGADLMCFHCEMGYDTWHNDPSWEMEVRLNLDGRWISPWMKAKDAWGGSMVFYRTSQLKGVARTRIMAAAEHLCKVFDDVDINAHYEFRMVQTSQGYWE